MITKEFIEAEYFIKERSIHDIAAELGTYPNKIKRAIIKHGFKLRSKSEAQSTALKSGRHKHPTRGTKHKESSLVKISEGVVSYWKNLGEEEYKRRVEKAKELWVNMPEEDKIALRQAAVAAISKTKVEGSRIEKFLLGKLREQKYHVEFHKKGLLDNSKMHLDLFLPELALAIEVDGPAHSYPIWGVEHHQACIRSDIEKSGWLLSHNFILIRVKQTRARITQKYLRDLWNVLSVKVAEIKANPPVKNNRYIELEF